MPDFKIEIRENGPMRVYGAFELVDQQGETYTQPEGAVGYVVPLRRIRQQAVLRRLPPDLRIRGGEQSPLDCGMLVT